MANLPFLHETLTQNIAWKKQMWAWLHMFVIVSCGLNQYTKHETDALSKIGNVEVIAKVKYFIWLEFVWMSTTLLR